MNMMNIGWRMEMPRNKENYKIQCAYCHQVLPPEYCLVIKKWDIEEGNYDYDDYSFCSEKCLEGFLKKNLFKLLGKELRIEKEE